MAALLRSLAGGSRRCCLQQLVWEPHFGVGRIGAGPAFRPHALSQELDRDPLRWACRFGAERRSRPSRANPYFRALVGAARPVDQKSATGVRFARQDGAQAARVVARSGRRRSPPAPPPRRPPPPSKPAPKPLELSLDRAAADRRPPNRSPSASAVGDALTGSPLDRRLTFATFQVGRSNELAFNAAQRVANPNRGGTPAFCPLYVHSTVGLGKTHLLQAVAHTAAQQGRSVIYLTAEKFMYGFVAALQSQTSIAFKERLRAIDLLIFDDAQFLQGKNIQAECGHALNALLDAGRGVIVAADRPPNDLESLDERVRSRLSVGLCVEIGALDEPLRLKILEARVMVARAEEPHFDVSPTVLAYVARAIRSNGRDLEGAVNRLRAHYTQTGPALSVETAETAIRDLIRTHELKRVKIEDIQKLVASHYSVSRADILSSRRTAAVVKP